MLRSSLQQTLSPQADVRKGAERFLESVASQKGFVLVVLQVLEGANESMDVRLAAALLFKNFIKKSWDPEKQGCVAPDEKEVVKQHIVELMCRMPETIQKQLIEALATIGEYDFPHAWQTLLAELVAKLKVETDWQVRNGVLMTANTIFKRFRNVFRSDSLYSELKHCLEVFQEPLLQFFLQTGNELRVVNAPKPQQLQMMAALRIMTRIFYSLNWQDLPEYFEDHISEWMTAFLSYFEYVNPALVDADNEDEPDPIDLLLVAIVENVNLYADKYDEEFKPYLEQFTQVIWNLLANRISLMPKHDELAAKCMKFLTLVSSRAIHRHVFSSPAVLAEMCNIVVKNLQLRSSDEELFEDNAMELICEANMIMSDIEMWQALLSGIIRVLAEDDTSSVVKDTDDMLEDLEQTGYEAGYSKLHFASVVPSDLLVDYPPPKGYFVSELAKLSAMRPGVYLAHVQQHLSPKETELLQAMFLQYNATFQ
ncbi:hypothetical protein P43SY_008448 [Pythium insidiosum]|uniref:Importin N-terminal domain-containing protein n=1 Tax=Pythium insidiosum TaxID=114742 RepID=A0AAD5LW06_PYTIN|nr:hypothetical protein P43SY_008448 [Pythium insidiosum]